MSSNHFRRGFVGALAIAGALGLAACNNETASVSTPSGSTAATSSQTSTTEPPTSSEAPTSDESSDTSSATAEESSPSESSSTSSDGSSDSAPATKGGKLTSNGAQLKFNDKAIIKQGSYDGKFALKVKSLTAAPESAYSAANLNKSNGKMYYINFDVTYLGGAKYGFEPYSVNHLWIRPVFDSSQTGRAGGNPYEDLPGCKESSGDEMEVGQTESVCYYYQITGPAPTKAMWNDHETSIVWSK